MCDLHVYAFHWQVVGKGHDQIEALFSGHVREMFCSSIRRLASLVVMFAATDTQRLDQLIYWGLQNYNLMLFFHLYLLAAIL